MQIGDKFYFNSDDENTQKYYTERANWCNENNAMISEIEPIEVEVEEKYFDEEGKEKTHIVTKTLRQFEIQAIPEPTEEEIIAELKEVRKSYLSQTDTMVSTPDYPITDGERELLLQYREYLRHIPENEGYPYDSEGNVVHIMTFEEWKQ